VRLSRRSQHDSAGGPQALEKLLLEETKIDAAARLKIASQRKIIMEGSQEWDILYRKYYNDEVKKLGL
jgi:hypothetical protein